jgi:hypothetical protein
LSQLFYRLFNFFNCSRHFYTSVFVDPRHNDFRMNKLTSVANAG